LDLNDQRNLDLFSEPPEFGEQSVKHLIRPPLETHLCWQSVAEKTAATRVRVMVSFLKSAWKIARLLNIL